MKVTLHAAAGYVDAATLSTLLKETAGDFDYMMLDGAEDSLFHHFGLPQAQDLQTWPEGRAFGPLSELRWRSRRDEFAICYMTEADSLPAPFLELPDRLTHRGRYDDLKITLWGDHSGADDIIDGRAVWHEAQIPRLLSYPLDPAPSRKNVALKVRRYWRDNQVVAFIRFIEPVLAGETNESLPEVEDA
jgi:hypothetical protein